MRGTRRDDQPARADEPRDDASHRGGIARASHDCDVERALSAGPYATIEIYDLLATQRDPLAFLRRVREALAPGGTLTASFANVVGGFVITDRMLKMFKKREPVKTGASGGGAA